MEDAKGTIFPNPNLREEWAAQRFKKALRGIGSDEKMIIKMLVSHDSLQREEIEKKYKAIFGQDLIDDLKAELGGHFEDTVVALLTSQYDILTQALKESLRFMNADGQTLTEILCSRDAEEINSLAWWYESSMHSTLENDLKDNLSGDFGRIMTSLLVAERPPEESEANEEEIHSDVQDLYDAGVGMNGGSDATRFIMLFTNRSFSHLRRVFQDYQKFSDEPIETSIRSQFSGDVRDALLAIDKWVTDPYGFFAERLNMALRGVGTDDRTLIRIVVTRSEKDLENIKKRYSEMYGVSLSQDIKEDTAGDYAKLLLAIVNNSDTQ